MGVSPLINPKSNKRDHARHDNPCKEMFPLGEKKFQRKLFHVLVEMNEKLDKILAVPSSCNISGKVEANFTAMESIDEFQEFEDKLQNDDFRELVQQKLQLCFNIYHLISNQSASS